MARRRQEERPADRRRRRMGGIALALLLAAALYYALFGGEYSVFEVRRLGQRVAEEQARLDSLRAEVDSLEARAALLADDSATIERIARERYGMIRPGERLYRFVEEDSAEADSLD
ncbi:MAG TPA: septum formation initiator family protein [Longimicrobiales bacterium]|nr:septum formation initiator family protein [Longimicrobiales bacterium]